MIEIIKVNIFKTKIVQYFFLKALSNAYKGRIIYTGGGNMKHRNLIKLLEKKRLLFKT